MVAHLSNNLRADLRQSRMPHQLINSAMTKAASSPIPLALAVHCFRLLYLQKSHLSKFKNLTIPLLISTPLIIFGITSHQSRMMREAMTAEKNPHQRNQAMVRTSMDSPCSSRCTIRQKGKLKWVRECMTESFSRIATATYTLKIHNL